MSIDNSSANLEWYLRHSSAIPPLVVVLCCAMLRSVLLYMLRYFVPCCAMFCYVVPCCAMLCYFALCCAMFCYVVKFFAKLCYVVLCCAMLCYELFFWFTKKGSSPLIYSNYKHVKLSLSIPLGRKQIKT